MKIITIILAKLSYFPFNWYYRERGIFYWYVSQATLLTGCSDVGIMGNRTSSLELEGREAKQLGSLSREGGIDKVIGKNTQSCSLWRWLLSGVRERYPSVQVVYVIQANGPLWKEICSTWGKQLCGRWFIMTQAMSSYPQIQMKSNTHDPCSGSLYRVHHHHMPTHWQ